MPPQPPATPPYTHVQTNKENMPTNSPYYGGNTSLGIPNFKPGDMNSLSAIPTQPIQPKKIITAGNPTQPNLINLQPQAILNNAQQQLMQRQQQQQAPKRLVGNVGINNNPQTMPNQVPPKPTPVKINNNVPAQPTAEGNCTPKSQCGDSDDEGEDDVNKK